MLNGVCAASLNLAKPPSRATRSSCFGPACAPRARPTSWLMDAGVQFGKRVRFIFGTDEETLWRCINRYKEREELPGMGFSPDARFPLTYAEKGLLQLHLTGSNTSGLRLAGGSIWNHRGELDPHDITFEDDNPLCGDKIHLELELDGDRVRDVRFEGQGCAISTASASLMTEALKGRTLAEAHAFLRERRIRHLPVTRQRDLVAHAVFAGGQHLSVDAIQRHLRQTGQPGPDAMPLAVFRHKL